MASVTVVITTDEYQNQKDFEAAVRDMLSEYHLYLGEGNMGIYFTTLEMNNLLEYNWRYEIFSKE